jgi:predicted O-linked N-acetylglucosamine transferase (SPINDLY family)
MATIADALTIALQHHQAGRLQEAEAIYRQVLQLQPDHPHALHLLGVSAHQAGRHDVAVDCISRAIGLDPTVAEFHLNLGEAYREQGKLEEAVASYRQALALKPDFAEAFSNMSIALREQGQLEEAIECCRQALALKPAFAGGLTNLGTVLKAQGRLAEAEAIYRQALTLDPAFAEARANLGAVLNEQGKLEEAVAAYRQVLALKPVSAEACNNLGAALRDLGRLEEAVASYRQALALKPAYAEACSNLGNVLKDQGELEEAVASYRQALALKPDYADAHSNLLLCLHYHPAADPATIFACYREWHERHASKPAVQMAPHGNRRERDRPLRVGYVSADFKRHPVGYFIEPVLSAHDKAQVRVYCYSMARQADEVTVRLQAHADVWRSIVGMSDEAVAGLIRGDEIDILVDLAGHTAGNRLLVFARKPAPVQVTWIGFCTTTGLETMDYLLTDGFYAPPEGQQMFTEQLVHLPANHLCFRPPAYAPPVAPCPAALRGYPTFGCFNNLAKVNTAVVAVWSTILQRVPGARLMLRTLSLTDRATRERYHKLLQAHGIAAERVELGGALPHAELLAQYGQIDVALDPFPYCGGWSTCEALWMGVPVVTLAGASFLSCVGAGLLSSVGAPELIARSPGQYVERAVELGRDVARLTLVREGLRARVAASPLCDAVAFTRHLEQAYRMMWEIYVKGEPPRRIHVPADR